MEKRNLQWHPAFGAALRITLKEEMEFLEMQEEYLLSKKPPQIDILIVKKLRDFPVKKAIGRIFRQHNIIEYKARAIISVSMISTKYTATPAFINPTLTE